MSDRAKKLFGLKQLVERTKEEQRKAALGEGKTAEEVREEKAEAREEAEKILSEPIVSMPEAEAVSVGELETAKKKLVERYGNAAIYRLAGRELLHYELPVPRPTASEKAIISTVREAATRLISISPYRIRDPEQRRNVYFNQIMDILRSSRELSIPKGRYEFYANAIVREMVGYGLIDDLIRDDRLEEIMIIGSRKPVYVFHRKYEMMTTNIEFFNDNEIQDLINRIARGVGRRVDMSSPLLDARLPDGSRVNATISPASISGSTLTIRKFREDPYSIIDLINTKTLSAEAAAFLWLCVDGLGVRPANILIAGGTGSGKTTTLNVLAAFIPDNERIISIEDTAELNLPLNHWIRFEAKPPGLEGKGELTMDILTKNSLRMRPNRIIVGEVRHHEAFTLFTAMNTGHDGCMGTIHANSPDETIVRVTSPPMKVPELMIAGLDFIIVEHRIHDRKKGTIRRITEIAEVRGVLEGKARTVDLFKRNAAKDKLVRLKKESHYISLLQELSGLKKSQIWAELKKREKLLKKIQEKGIRRLADVAKETQKHMIKKAGEKVKF